MTLELRAALPADAVDISRLVQASFLEYVAPEWSSHAIEKFLSDSSPNAMAALIGDALFSAVARSGQETVGFLLLVPPNLLKALFVHRSWHKRGVARKLWQLACHRLQHGAAMADTIELNASTFAVEAYRKLGFRPISPPVVHEGCLSTRMAFRLPPCGPIA